MEEYFLNLADGAIQLTRKGFPPKRMNGFWVEKVTEFECILVTGSNQKFFYRKLALVKFGFITER